MTIRGVNQAILGEPEMFYLARLSGNVPMGITGTAPANGSSVSFRRIVGMVAFPENVPESPKVEVPGDGGVIAQYTRQATGVISIPAAFTVFDQTAISELTDKTVYTNGSWEISTRTRRCRTFKNLAGILSGRAISQESGTVGDEGWWTIFYWRMTGDQLNLPFASGAAAQTPISLSLNETDTTWWEEDMDTNYDMGYSWATDPIISDYPLMVDTYKGTGAGSQTTVLSQTPAGESATYVRAWEDGTIQAYTTDYTVVAATKTVTHVTNPGAAADYVFVYEYVPTC
jgi:hypothetical protein